jgi:hypothetical protein
MKSVLILSPYFPPATLAGVHRARHLAKHLPAAGWQPIVLCVEETSYEEALDPDLGRLVPDTVEVVKVAAISASLTRRVGLGDISLRAFRSLRASLFDILRRRAPAAVFITGAPYYQMLLAPTVRRQFGVPVVLDFQDPWVSAWGTTLPRLSKGGVTDQLARVLEPRALAGAAFVTSVSEVQNVALANRYPWFDRRCMAAIPIGCDSADFAALRAMPSRPGASHIPAQGINLSFVGTVMPRTAPVLQVLLAAFARARSENPNAMARVHLNFIGTSNQPNGHDVWQVKPLAEAAGVADVVHETPARVPYLEALGVLAKSDALMLVGSDESHYTASKIYPGLMSGRPYLSLFHAASSANSILANAGGGLVHAFDSPSGIVELIPALADAFVRLATQAGGISPAKPAAYEAYEARSIARAFGGIFDSLTENAKRAA